MAGVWEKGRRVCGGVLAVVAIAGCSPIVQNHGYTPPDYALAELQVGQDSREKVVEIVGAPIASGFSNQNTWYYVSSSRRLRGPRAPLVTDREVLAMDFSEAGVLTNIRRYGIQDGRVVRLSTRVTDPSVRDIGLLRQIFGNVGTPTAEDFLRDQ